MGWRDSSIMHALRLLRRDPARLPPDVQAIPDPVARFAAAMVHHGTTDAMLGALLSAARVQAIGFAALALAAAALQVWLAVAVLVLLSADRARMACELRDRRFYSLLGWVLAVLPK
ncbi:hypothetical protein [Caenispirillum bisanense]|uniref:hypothetical protein n=1 Tax=Caenispirillum bisanense TaxID=414052 RepID=UPI0031D65AF4